MVQNLEKYSLLSSSLSSFLNSDLSIYGSNIWNHVSKCKEVIAKGVTWKLGNGRKVRFWEDPWLFNKPLIDFYEWASHAPSYIGSFGTLVADY